MLSVIFHLNSITSLFGPLFYRENFIYFGTDCY